MIRIMYDVSAHDSVHQQFVFRRMGEHKLVVMPQYEDLVCPKCRKLNEQAALARGISPDVVIKSRRPLLPSAEYFYLVNERGRALFSSLLAGEIDYYRIPSCEFYVASAKTWLEPKETDAGFRFVGGRCGDCGRPRELIWDRTATVVRVPEFKPFLCVKLETRMGALPTWLLSEHLADELKKASPPVSVGLRAKQIDDGVSG